MNLSALDGRLLALREKAKEGRDPTAADETLAYLLNVAEARKPRKILEIGAAEGLTSCALLLCSHAHLTAIEADADRAARAREHFRAFGVEDRAVLYEGDAGEILPMMTDTFDFIFLDGPKVQYRNYLSDCKRMLQVGGVLISDDVLLFGWVRGEPPKKRRMLAEHLREYLRMLEADPGFDTQVLEIAEGLAVSTKIR